MQRSVLRSVSLKLRKLCDLDAEVLCSTIRLDPKPSWELAGCFKQLILLCLSLAICEMRIVLSTSPGLLGSQVGECRGHHTA